MVDSGTVEKTGVGTEKRVYKTVAEGWRAGMEETGTIEQAAGVYSCQTGSIVEEVMECADGYGFGVVSHSVHNLAAHAHHSWALAR